MELEPRDPHREASQPKKDLTDLQQHCHELERRVKAGLRAGRAAMWVTAAALYEFDRHSGWSALGYRTRADWLADPEVGMTERSYQRLVRVWREAVIRRQLDPPALARLDLSKVEIVLAAVDEGSAKLPDALADAEALGWRELRRKYSRPALPWAHPTTEQTTSHGPSFPDAGSGASREDEAMRQLELWLALYNEVRQAAAAGEPLPRINAQVIVPGLDALAYLLQAAGVRGINRLMP
jgi:hypothetical protein